MTEEEETSFAALPLFARAQVLWWLSLEGHERQGTAYDPGAEGHEKQGRIGKEAQDFIESLKRQIAPGWKNVTAPMALPGN